MGGSDFIFDCVHLLYYKCHKINPNRGGSYIDSLYTVTVALNYKEIETFLKKLQKLNLL